MATSMGKVNEKYDSKSRVRLSPGGAPKCILVCVYKNPSCYCVGSVLTYV